MRQLQNNPEKIRSFYQNHRSNMPSDSAFTYGLINKLTHRQREVLGLLARRLSNSELAKLLQLSRQLRKSTWQQFECVSIEPTAWPSFWARHGGTVAVVPTMRVCPPPDIETPAAAISGRGARPHSRHCRARRVFDIYRLHPTRAVKRIAALQNGSFASLPSRQACRNTIRPSSLDVLAQ